MLSESEKPIDETQKELNEVIINSYDGDFEEKGVDYTRSILNSNNYFRKGGKENGKITKHQLNINSISK